MIKDIVVDEISIKSVFSFFSAYKNIFYDKIFTLPDFIKEQVYYRILVCENTCLNNKINKQTNQYYSVCEKCGCPTLKKVYSQESCDPSKFPNLTNKYSWEVYKKDNNITITAQDISRIENYIINN